MIGSSSLLKFFWRIRIFSIFQNAPIQFLHDFRQYRLTGCCLSLPDRFIQHQRGKTWLNFLLHALLALSLVQENAILQAMLVGYLSKHAINMKHIHSFICKIDEISCIQYIIDNLIMITNLLHDLTLHLIWCTAAPWQDNPPFTGLGLLQTRLLVRMPGPHVLLQRPYWPHWLHLPFAAVTIQ